MTKIIVITSTFPKSGEDKVPAFVRDQITNLKTQYNDLNFYVLAPSYFDKTKIEKLKEFDEIRYHYFWPRRYEKLAGRGILPALKENKLRYFLIPFFVIFQLINLIILTKKVKPDIIYAHWFTPQAITTCIVSILFNVPFVFTTHAQDVIILKKIPIFGKFIANFVVRRASAWTSDSIMTEENLKNTINITHYKKEKGLVAPMPINDTDYIKTEPDKFIQIDHDKNKYLLFIGRFAEKKGVERLLDIFKELIEENNNLFLILAGEGPLKKSYKKRIEEIGIDKNKVIFTGYVNKAQKKFLFEESDFFIAPSLVTKEGDVEGLPVVFLESLYFGKVTIASYQSNATEIISDRENGFIIDPTNITESKEKIKEILKLNENEINKVKKNAKILGERFTDKHLTKKYYKHLFDPLI